MPDRNRSWIAITVAIVAALAGLVMFGRWAVSVPRRAAESVVERAVGREERTIDLGTLVTQIREMSRLETASMRVMHVSTIRQSMGVIPNTLAGDEMTFLAVGDVIAGIDLGALRRDDVRLDPDGTLTLRLPPPQILVTRIDNRESRVMDRKTGLLRRHDQNLETRIRQHAESAVRRQALNKGVLVLASRNAEQKLADLLMTLGFERVSFERSSIPAERASAGLH
ncbi:MAG TPA: DUF4230 domain-containing protein [Thermoanaerobaculia bacterium]|nr:DUF4230 domain-containing protein [Thermoanaerobaculia bacterium]